jgi:hypothetical protein
MFPQPNGLPDCRRCSVIELQRELEGIANMFEHARSMTPLVFESCHSTWLFDTSQRRFRRILKSVSEEEHSVATGWRQFYGLELEPGSESFTVLHNPEGTRLHRSWRHTRDCTQCGGNTTAELSLDELRRAVG